MSMRISRIVSGGQTGADRGGLDAAIHAGIPHGGWCPKGRKAEDGVIPAIYSLTETKSADYKARTDANVKDSDATVIFTRGLLDGGSLLTARCAQKHAKRWLHVDLAVTPTPEAAATVIAWLCAESQGSGAPTPRPACVLNVAGQRESKSPGIQVEVRAVMAEVLARCAGG